MVVLQRGPLSGLVIALVVIVLSVGGIGLVAESASQDATNASHAATADVQQRIFDQRKACLQNGRTTVADINLNWFQSLSEVALARLVGSSTQVAPIRATLSERARLEANAALVKTARVDPSLVAKITYAEPRAQARRNGFSCAAAYPVGPMKGTG